MENFTWKNYFKNERDFDVLKLMAQNFTKAQIADKTGIDKSTVDYIERLIFVALDAHTVQQVVQKCWMLGILTKDDFCLN